MEDKSLTMLKHYEALKDYMNKDFVFKKCREYEGDVKHKCLVILKKPITDFKCNESRSGIVDTNFAKFRCNGLITVAIYNMYTKNFIDYLHHRMENFSGSYEVLYKVEQLTIPHDYNEYIEIICTSGIHYFLTLEAALNYRYGIVSRYIQSNHGLYKITYSDQGEGHVY